MARLPRLTIPGQPHYVVQRGNNLQAIFVDGQDYASMKDLLREMGRRFGVEIHAFILLPNQLHLLLTPQTAQSLPQFMQSVGRTYVRTFNNRHGCSGTLWEGRYRATVLEAQAWLLPAMGGAGAPSRSARPDRACRRLRLEQRTPQRGRTGGWHGAPAPGVLAFGGYPFCAGSGLRHDARPWCQRRPARSGAGGRTQRVGAGL